VSTKAAVIGMKARGGNVVAKVVENRTRETLLPVVYENVKDGTTIMTDEYSAYNDLKNYYNHFTVNDSAKECVNLMAHTNGVENFWSHLKRGIDGIYHQVSKPHLQAYVNEFSFRFNTRKDKTQQRFDLVLSDLTNTRLTYNKLTGNE